MWDEEEEVKEALAGMDISFLLKGDAEEDLRRGAVIGHVDKEPSAKQRIQVRLLYLGLQPYVLGNISVLHAGSDHVECELESITKVYIKNKKYQNTVRDIDGKSIMIFKDEVASVVLEVKNPIVVEKSEEIPKLGRVILRKKGRVIAAAIVEEVLD